MTRRTFSYALLSTLGAVIFPLSPSLLQRVARPVAFDAEACRRAVRIYSFRDMPAVSLALAPVAVFVEVRTPWGQWVTRVMAATITRTRRERGRLGWKDLEATKTMNARASVQEAVADACRRGWWPGPEGDCPIPFTEIRFI